MYIAIAILGFAILAVVSILDKYILTSKKTDPALYAFFNTIFCFPLFLFFFFIKMPNESMPWIFSFVAGLLYGVSLWTLYKGIEKGNISYIGPLVGASVPLATLFLGRVFLHEILTNFQIVAVILFISGSLVIAFEKRKKGQGLRAGTLWGFFSGILFAISLTATKFVYNEVNFVTGILMVGFFTGVSGLIFAALPRVRNNIFKKNTDKSSNRMPFVITNIVLSLLGVVLVQLAISMGVVSIVNSLEGVRYGLLIILVALLSKFFPRVFYEKHSKQEVIQEVLAVLLIVVGLSFLIL